MPQAKKKSQSEVVSTESTAKVTLKSIRNPRFTVELDDIPSSDTVLSIKERLLGDPDGPLADEGYKISNIKLLIKGKVISDSKTVDEIGSVDETTGSLVVSFVAMISTPDVTAKEEVEEGDKSLLSESVWGEIHSILKKNLSSEQADSTLEKFKSLNSL